MIILKTFLILEIRGDFLKKAEKPFCFIAFCIEFEKFYNTMNNTELDSFTSHLPIQLYASCNGYQHIALLTKQVKVFDVLLP